MAQDVRYRNRIGGNQPYRDDPVRKVIRNVVIVSDQWTLLWPVVVIH
jgi:hypothetical protein